MMRVHKGAGVFLVNQQLMMENQRILCFSKSLAQSQKVMHYLKEPISKC